MQASLSTRPLDGAHYRHEAPSSSSYSSPVPAKSLVSSPWHVLEQAPPPSLREILGAYHARGDGDRDMLLAMLSAKSAEDQRIAAVASLHRTMLEYQQLPTPPPPPSHTSYPAPPPQYTSYARARPYSAPDSPGADDRERERDAPRKRHRRSRSRSSSPRSSASGASSSPYSSASRSPNSRSAMTIDSIIHGRRDDLQLPPLASK